MSFENYMINFWYYSVLGHYSHVLIFIQQSTRYELFLDVLESKFYCYMAIDLKIHWPFCKLHFRFVIIVIWHSTYGNGPLR